MPVINIILLLIGFLLILSGFSSSTPTVLQQAIQYLQLLIGVVMIIGALINHQIWAIRNTNKK